MLTNTPLNRSGWGGGGVLPEKLGRGVWFASENPYPIYDQNVRFSLPYLPCIRLARGKFEPTNQDSAGGKKSSVLTSTKQVRKGFEIRQLFSLEMALNIHEKGFTFS